MKIFNLSEVHNSAFLEPEIEKAFVLQKLKVQNVHDKKIKKLFGAKFGSSCVLWKSVHVNIWKRTEKRTRQVLVFCFIIYLFSNYRTHIWSPLNIGDWRRHLIIIE